jgi:hypothetical protein
VIPAKVASCRIESTGDDSEEPIHSKARERCCFGHHEDDVTIDTASVAIYQRAQAGAQSDELERGSKPPRDMIVLSHEPK